MMLKSGVFVCGMLVATSALAQPTQLDVIGLVPGVSTQAEVEKAKQDSGYVIGGYGLICSSEYMDGVLSNLTCFTGEEFYSRDMSNTETYRIASNLEVHKVLIEGFTKKWGRPTSVNNSIVTNGFGHEFKQNIVVWTDKKGNQISLFSMGTKTNEGIIILKSAKQLAKDEEESKKAEQQRKF